MPKLKMEELNQFNSIHNEAKNHCTYPVVLYATDSLLCTVPPNLANDVSVETFFHLVKAFLVLLFGFLTVIYQTQGIMLYHTVKD